MNLDALNQSMLAKIQRADEPPRKVSRQTPNIANIVGDYVAATWLELSAISDLWVTGSHVWAWLYRETPPDGADVDMFATTEHAYELTVGFLKTIVVPAPDGQDKPQPVKSRSGDEKGQRVHTSRGWVDLWYAPRPALAMVQTYPSDGYAHCRAAYCPSSRTLVVSPNEATENYVDPYWKSTHMSELGIALAGPPRARNAPKLGRLRRVWRWLVSKLTPGRPVDRLIGRADRILSEYLVLAEDPRLDAADRQTLKHHADDFIGVGYAALKRLKP